MRQQCYGILGALAIAQTASAQAAAPAVPFMPMGEIASAPLGYIQMCERDAVLCDTGLAPVVTYRAAFNDDGVRTPIDGKAELVLVDRVNREVNQSTLQVADFDSSGENDRWNPLAVGMPVGDCEDIAIEKRLRLMRAGFPAERLFLAVAYKYGSGLHTVLIARLGNGDVVLDSLVRRVRPWREVRYQWLRLQTPGQPQVWRAPFQAPQQVARLSEAGSGRIDTRDES